jgi:hypothetical protein
MAKTVFPVAMHCSTNPDLPVMMLFSATVIGPFVWNFEFGALGFI